MVILKPGPRSGAIHFFQESVGFADFLEFVMSSLLSPGILRWKPVGMPALDLGFIGAFDFLPGSARRQFQDVKILIHDSFEQFQR